MSSCRAVELSMSSRAQLIGMRKLCAKEILRDLGAYYYQHQVNL